MSLSCTYVGCSKRTCPISQMQDGEFCHLVAGRRGTCSGHCIRAMQGVGKGGDGAQCKRSPGSTVPYAPQCFARCAGACLIFAGLCAGALNTAPSCKVLPSHCDSQVFTCTHTHVAPSQKHVERLCDGANEAYMQMSMAELLACHLRSFWPNMSGRGPCCYSRDAQSRPSSPCRPLVRCSHFVQVWTSHLPGLDHPASDLVNTHTLGREQGLTFWRPQTPSGYAALGDCVTGGISQPTFQVHTIYV